MAKVSMHTGRNKVSRKHNTRNYEGWNKDGHINASRSGEKVTLIDRPLKEVYEEMYGESIARFNEKQKKNPSRVTSVQKYYTETKKNQVEMIVQFGKEGDQPLTGEQYVQLYSEYVERFQKDNPNLVVFGAYIHLDETTPHLHLDYLPVSFQNKRGMEVKVSMDGALREQGYARQKNEKYADNPWKRWERSERTATESFVSIALQKMGVDAPVTPHEKCNRRHMEYWQYKIQEMSSVYHDLQHNQEQRDRLESLLKEVAGHPAEDTVKGILKGLEDEKKVLIGKAQIIKQQCGKKGTEIDMGEYEYDEF